MAGWVLASCCPVAGRAVRSVNSEVGPQGVGAVGAGAGPSFQLHQLHQLVNSGFTRFQGSPPLISLSSSSSIYEMELKGSIYDIDARKAGRWWDVRANQNCQIIDERPD